MPHDGRSRKKIADMKAEVLDNADIVALKAAAIIAGEARKAVLLRGLFILAVSGGKTPWKMLRAHLELVIAIPRLQSILMETVCNTCSIGEMGPPPSPIQ